MILAEKRNMPVSRSSSRALTTPAPTCAGGPLPTQSAVAAPAGTSPPAALRGAHRASHDRPWQQLSDPLKTSLLEAAKVDLRTRVLRCVLVAILRHLLMRNVCLSAVHAHIPTRREVEVQVVKQIKKLSGDLIRVPVCWRDVR